MKTLMRMFWVVLAVTVVGASPAFAKGKGKTQVTGVVNINTATASQLDMLPGVGATAAKRIIEYRAQHPFKNLDELRKVKGFGKKKVEKLRPYLALAGATTAKVTKGAPAEVSDSPAQGRSSPKKR